MKLKTILYFCYSIPKEILKVIQPYFKLDFLLPRTYVASLNYQQIMVLEEKDVFPDIILGAIYYFIDTEEKYPNDNFVYVSLTALHLAIICKA